MITQQERIYGSKIMLVGEYGVVVGGSALTIPFNKFQARVRTANQIPQGMEAAASRSFKYLQKLYDFIRIIPAEKFHTPPDLSFFSKNHDQYWLEMDIPSGYGLGSSGAVSAAIYDLFFPNSSNLTLPQQKEDLGAIESYFHGKSSGVDALTCHSGTPLYFKPDGSVVKVDFNPADLPMGYRFFLLDSKERFDTEPLVNHFLKQMENSGFATSIKYEYLTLNHKLIESLLGIREVDPALLVRVISDFQLTHFRKMIPPKMLDLWIEGQVSNEYYMKLSGSGGGYMLGITHHSSMETLEDRWKEDLIWVE